MVGVPNRRHTRGTGGGRTRPFHTEYAHCFPPSATPVDGARREETRAIIISYADRFTTRTGTSAVRSTVEATLPSICRSKFDRLWELIIIRSIPLVPTYSRIPAATPSTVRQRFAPRSRGRCLRSRLRLGRPPSGRCFRFWVFLWDHQHWGGASVEDPPGDAADETTRDARQSLLPDDNEVASDSVANSLIRTAGLLSRQTDRPPTRPRRSRRG